MCPMKQQQVRPLSPLYLGYESSLAADRHNKGLMVQSVGDDDVVVVELR